jgi:hypothetical protein
MFMDIRLARCLPQTPLQRLVVGVVAPDDPGAGIGGEACRREDVLPTPFPRRLRILAGQRIRQVNLAVFYGQVAGVKRSNPCEVLLQRCFQAAGQHRHSVLEAFALPDQDFQAREVYVLDTQPRAFHHPHPRTVDQPQHEAGGSARAVEDRTDFIDRQHDRTTLGRLGMLHAVEPRQFGAEHLAVEKQQGRLRLVLGGSRHLADDRQVREESLDLGAAQFPRVALAVM